MTQRLYCDCVVPQYRNVFYTLLTLYYVYIILPQRLVLLGLHTVIFKARSHCGYDEYNSNIVMETSKNHYF